MKNNLGTFYVANIATNGNEKSTKKYRSIRLYDM